MNKCKCQVLYVILTGILIFPAYGVSAWTDYDPLTPVFQNVPEVVDLTIDDSSRKRDIPVRVYLPSGKSSSPGEPCDLTGEMQGRDRFLRRA